MARAPVMAAGGIVMRSDAPLIAIVRLRKRDHWVLPKGKLESGETARAAAEREVVEETGHDVTVHEFVGTVAYEAAGRPKIVHFWRMEAAGLQIHPLMADIKAVAWLPLAEAVAQLSRGHERAFLAEIGPQVVAAADAARHLAAVPARRVDPIEEEIIEPAAPSAPARPVLPDIGNAPTLVPAPRPALLSRMWRWLSGRV